MHALAHALNWAAILGEAERNPAEVERLASDLIELTTRQNFALWLAAGEVLRGWARSASGDTAKGIAWIEDGIDGWRETGAMLILTYWLALKAEALHLADRVPEALEAAPKSQWVRRTWIPTTPLLTACGPLPLVQGAFVGAS